MIKSPHTYSEWVGILDIFKSKENDTDVLIAMQSGTIEWQSGVAERFSKKLIDSVNKRLNDATDKFQKDMKRGGGQEGEIIRALLSLRRELSFLSKAINLPVLPEKDRQQYVNLVLNQADNIQRSLEDSAKNDRSGRMASIVRNHKVNAF